MNKINPKELEKTKKEMTKLVLDFGQDSKLHLRFALAYNQSIVKNYPVYDDYGQRIGDVDINLPKGYIFASHVDYDTAYKHLLKVEQSGIKAVIKCLPPAHK